MTALGDPVCLGGRWFLSQVQVKFGAVVHEGGGIARGVDPVAVLELQGEDEKRAIIEFPMPNQERMTAFHESLVEEQALVVMLAPAAYQGIGRGEIKWWSDCASQSNADAFAGSFRLRTSFEAGEGHQWQVLHRLPGGVKVVAEGEAKDQLLAERKAEDALFRFLLARGALRLMEGE